MTSIFNSWPVAVLVGVVVKSCFIPGWHSAVEVLGAMILVGGVHYLQSLKDRQVENKAIAELREQVDQLRNGLVATRMKIGLKAG